LTQLKQLVKNFGESEISIHSTESIDSMRTTLRVHHNDTSKVEFKTTIRNFFRKRILTAHQFAVLTINTVKPFSPITCKAFRTLSVAVLHRHSQARKHIQREAQPKELFSMWSMLRYIQPKSKVDKAVSLITNGFRRFNIDPRPPSVISIPYRIDINIGAMRILPQKIASKLPVCVEQRKLIAGEIRHVFTRRTNVADQLINTRKLAKSFDGKEPCTCTEICKILKLKEKWTNAKGQTVNLSDFYVDGHLAIRALDLPSHVSPLLKVNVKHIPPPKPTLLRTELCESVER
jgi:hypothetical protein